MDQLNQQPRYDDGVNDMEVDTAVHDGFDVDDFDPELASGFGVGMHGMGVAGLHPLGAGGGILRLLSPCPLPLQRPLIPER